MKCALVMTGGIAKGAFQAGVIKSFAENNIKPSVVVGASAGALNSGMIAKLIAEGNYTPQSIQERIIDSWLYETSIYQLWGKGDITKKDTIRNIFADINTNPFMIIRRLSNLQIDVWQRLRILFSLSFYSILNNDTILNVLERLMKEPEEIVEDVICAVSLTDLFAQTENIKGQPINNYSDYVSFKFKKGENENLKKRFKTLREVVQASSCLPGMFPPASLDLHDNGDKRLYVDGGITKNAPFGRAIKLDPEIQYIFLVATSPITKPILTEINNFPDILGQVYEIVVTKDIANDYRKVVQINEKIKLLTKMLKRHKDSTIIRNEHNEDLCKLAGFKGIDDFVSKRCVEIIFIEPEYQLEGDPFAAMYRNDRKYLLDTYIKHGYEVGNKTMKKFKAKLAMEEEMNIGA